MGGDQATLDFYGREATAYADFVEAESASPLIARFAARLPAGGRLLDFGCGPGWGAAAFAKLGLQVSGFDGSPELAAEAGRRYGVAVTVGRFEDFAEAGAYDGIWASFCLLHDRRDAMPGHLGRLYRALRPGGQLYLGLKEGTGEERDDLGRFYVYYTEPEIRGLLAGAGFRVDTLETEPDTGFSGVPCTSMHVFASRG